MVQSYWDPTLQVTSIYIKTFSLQVIPLYHSLEKVETHIFCIYVYASVCKKEPMYIHFAIKLGTHTLIIMVLTGISVTCSAANALNVI